MDRDDEIRQIAYQLWEQEGRPEGRSEEHWMRAEQIWEEQQRQKVAADQPKPAPKRPAARRRSK